MTEGLCQCGCGQLAPISKKTNRTKGHVKGQPCRFIVGHVGWKGGIIIRSGYRVVSTPGHLRADSKGYVFEHILIAEKALGKPLPPSAQVHHVDGDGTNNAPGNLVICQDQAFHHLLHQRQRALDASGNADWRKCNVCKEYDAPSQVMIKGTSVSYHLACKSKYGRKMRKRRAMLRIDAVAALSDDHQMYVGSGEVPRKVKAG